MGTGLVNSIGGSRRVVVTGMGAVTPFGSGVERMWERLISGRSGITTLEAFDPSPYGTRVAGQARDFRPSDHLSQREISGNARCVQLAMASARMALEDARLRISGADTTRIGVFLGTSVGTAEYLAENHAVFL